jgi:geranylgeranyl diphosphate synthase type I
MDAIRALEEYQNFIEPQLAAFFAKAEPPSKAISSESLSAIKYLEEYTLRKAKRLRAALVYYTYLMMGGKQRKEAMRVSMFIEIIQSYLLMHDDVMDQDSLRRGGPTIHKIYEKVHKLKYSFGDPKHFGESMAINLGDIACHLACKLLADSKFDAVHKVRAMSKFHEQIVTVGFGQMLDVISSVKNDTSQEDVLRIHRYKTAAYTYETPISVGAILAGATDKHVKILNGYAVPAGIAFQIQDDILGMYGDESALGKSNISDLREGKHTLLITKAMEKANKKQVKVISQALGNPNITQQIADKVRQIIVETGSLDYSKQLAKEYVVKAQNALAAMPHWNGEGRKFLDGIAEYMIKREF